MGFEMPIPMADEARELWDNGIPEEVLIATSHLDQFVKVNFDLATSLKELMESETPCLENLAKGFKFGAHVQLVSNLKNVLLEKMAESNDEITAMAAQFRPMIAPAFLLGVRGNLQAKLDDWDEIKENPMF